MVVNPPALPPSINELTGKVVDCAYAVWSHARAGLLERAYEEFLEIELLHQGLRVRRQVPVDLTYRERRVEAAFRIDLLVDDCVVVEVKAVQEILPVHEAQILTYLQLARAPVGLLINFHTAHFRAGIRRFVAPRQASGISASLWLSEQT